MIAPLYSPKLLPQYLQSNLILLPINFYQAQFLYPTRCFFEHNHGYILIPTNTHVLPFITDMTNLRSSIPNPHKLTYTISSATLANSNKHEDFTITVIIHINNQSPYQQCSFCNLSIIIMKILQSINWQKQKQMATRYHLTLS